MIAFEDFMPEITRQGGFFSSRELEPLTRALGRANAWITENNLDVINVETVVLPNIHEDNEEGTTDPELVIPGAYRARWHQFIRVWYRQ